MVIDTKSLPVDSAPLFAPPPAYAASGGTQHRSLNNAPQQVQQYPPSSSQSYSTSPQWHNPHTVTQPLPADGWVGEQYRNQLYAECARGNHDETTSFGLCGIICAILLFPIGLICLCIDTEKKCSRCGVRLN